jgi:hypothetical protein
MYAEEEEYYLRLEIPPSPAAGRRGGWTEGAGEVPSTKSGWGLLRP